MRNQDKIELNELNKNSNGGTELVTRGLFDRLDESDLDGVQIITSRVRELDPDRIRILHLHDLPEDPECNHLADGGWRKFHGIVFCSYWQRDAFMHRYRIPFIPRHTVILNGVQPFEVPLEKNIEEVYGGGQIRLIYTPTPHRGLDVLYSAYNRVYEMWGDRIHLDVYSSFGLYGWPERDKQYEPLFNALREHPGITYHGWVPNDQLREALVRSNVFVYPSTWKETSCLCLIEAMSSMNLSVHSSLAALPETASGATIMYDYLEDKAQHVMSFSDALNNTLMRLCSSDPRDTYAFLQHGKSVADIKHSWDVSVLYKWKEYIRFLKEMGLDTSVIR